MSCTHVNPLAYTHSHTFTQYLLRCTFTQNYSSSTSEKNQRKNKNNIDVSHPSSALQVGCDTDRMRAGTGELTQPCYVSWRRCSGKTLTIPPGAFSSGADINIWLLLLSSFLNAIHVDIHVDLYAVWVCSHIGLMLSFEWLSDMGRPVLLTTNAPDKYFSSEAFRRVQV